MENSRYIAYDSGENNYYHDSDFYIMIFDTKEQKIIKHIYGSTRYAGSIDFKHEYLDLTNDKRRYEIQKQVKEVAKKQVLKYISNKDVEEGDVVKVTNPRARKFKGETFVVYRKKDFILRYGKVASTTLYGENEKSERIKTSESNVTVVEHNIRKIEEKANRLVLGLSYR